MAVSDTCTITSELGRIREVRAWALDHAHAQEVSGGDCWAVELALGEALANVIRHAYEGHGGFTIEVSLAIDASRLELEIRDTARPFARDSVTPLPLEIPRTGGYGLQLIEEVMDVVEYTGSESGGLLRMVKLRNA
jgi:anti-sigma regulatory factor (Ser/Thr protein kinase)